MSGRNPTGVNGYGEKKYPPDDILSRNLHQYAKERLSVENRLQRLETEFGLRIKKSKLAELNKQFGVPSVRKPPAAEVATQAVLDLVAADIQQRNGVGTISSLLANKGMPIPRDFIRNVLAQFAPDGLSRRAPGSRRIYRAPLVAPGPNYQWHGDGHEKLGSQGLRMHGVGLNIYGIKDQWSAFFLHLTVVPNDRLETTIGHVYLDCVAKYGFIPIGFVIDKGSETGLIHSFQTALRTEYTPELDAEQFPPTVHVSSVHNTPIEGSWRWFTERCGGNMKEIVQQGLQQGIYNPANPVHPALFNWLWPKIAQHQLDNFVEYWNNHKIRAQPDKPNMSGSTPRNGFMAPGSPAQDCRIEVDQCVIDALRDQIPVSREEAMRWVSDEFDSVASEVYQSIGSPSLTSLDCGWDIFTRMAQAM